MNLYKVEMTVSLTLMVVADEWSDVLHEACDLADQEYEENNYEWEVEELPLLIESLDEVPPPWRKGTPYDITEEGTGVIDCEKFLNGYRPKQPPLGEQLELVEEEEE